jgi:hypothetical protein
MVQLLNALAKAAQAASSAVVVVLKSTCFCVCDANAVDGTRGRSLCKHSDDKLCFTGDRVWGAAGKNLLQKS